MLLNDETSYRDSIKPLERNDRYPSFDLRPACQPVDILLPSPAFDSRKPSPRRRRKLQRKKEDNVQTGLYHDLVADVVPVLAALLLGHASLLGRRRLRGEGVFPGGASAVLGQEYQATVAVYLLQGWVGGVGGWVGVDERGPE